MTDSLGAASGSIELDAAKAMAALNQVSSGIWQMGSTQPGNGFGSWIRQNEQSINTLGTSIAGFGAVVLGAFGIATNTTLNFDAQISAVGATAGATETELAALREEALRLGADTTMGATEAAQAMEIMVKAGAPLEAVLNGGAQAAINLAEATGTNIELAAETTATAVNQFKKFGLTYQESADIITQASNASALDVNDFALALKTAGPIATSLGYDFQDLANMMVILGDAGIKGETGATAIRNILMGIADPAGAGAVALREFGVEVQNTDGTMKDLTQITTELAATWDDLSAAQQLQLAQSIAGEQGAASFMAIMDAQTDAVGRNSDAFAEAEARQKETGTAAEQAAARMNNLKGSIETLKGVLETITITFMSRVTPALQAVVEGLTSLAQMALRLPAPLQTFLVAATGITGVLATLAGGTLLLLPRMVALRGAVLDLTKTKSVGAAFTAIRTSLLGFLGPIALVVAAAGALYLAYKTNFLGFADLVNNAVSGVRKFVDQFRIAFAGLSQIHNPVTALLESFSRALRSLDLGPLNGIKETVASAFSDAGKAVSVFVKQFASLRKTTNVLSAAFGGVADALDSIGGGDIGWIKAISTGLRSAGRFVEDFLDTIDSLRIAFGFFRSHGADPITAALQALGRIFPQLSGVVQPVIGFIDRLKTAFSSALATGVNPIHAGLLALGSVVPALAGYIDHLIAQWSALADAGGSLGEALKALFAGDWAGMFDALGDAAQSMLEAFSHSLQGLGSLVAGVADAITNRFPALRPIFDGVATAVGAVSGAIGNLAGMAIDFATQESTINAFKNTWDFLRDAIGMISGAIVDVTGYVIDFATSETAITAYQAVWDGLKTSVSAIVTSIGELVGYVFSFATSEAAVNAYKAVWDSLKEVIGAITSDIATVVDYAIDFATQESTVNAFKGAWDGLKTSVDAIVTAIEAVVGYAVDFATHETTIATTKGAWDGLKASVDAITTAIESVVGYAIDFATSEAAIATYQGIWDGLRFAVSTTKSAISVIASFVPTFSATAIVEAFKTVWDNLKAAIDAIKGAIDTVTGLAPDFSSITGPIDAITSKIQGAIDAWNTFKGLFGGGGSDPNSASDGEDDNQGNPDPPDITEDPQLQEPGFAGYNFTAILAGLQSLKDRMVETKATFDISIPPIGLGFGAAVTWPASPLAALASIKGGFDITLPTLALQSQASFGAAKLAADTNMVGMSASVGASLAGVQLSFQAGLAGVAATSQAQFSAAKAAATNNVSSMKSSVESSTSSMASGAISNITRLNLLSAIQIALLQSRVKTAMMDMNTTAATQTSIMNIITGAAFSTMRSNASSAMTSMRSAVSAGMAGVVAAVRSGMSSAVSAASGMSGRFYGAGADAIQGLVNGARSRLGALQAVVSAAIAIMASIPALGNSPWPMMIGAGHDALDGLIQGVAERHRALGQVIDQTIRYFSDASPILSSSGPGYHQALLTSPVAAVSNVTTYNVFTLPTDEWVEVATAARTAPQRTATLMQRARSLQPQGGR
jgi:TP901 family phage tail tape measure protein